MLHHFFCCCTKGLFWQTASAWCITPCTGHQVCSVVLCSTCVSTSSVSLRSCYEALIAGAHSNRTMLSLCIILKDRPLCQCHIICCCHSLVASSLPQQCCLWLTHSDSVVRRTKGAVSIVDVRCWHHTASSGPGVTVSHKRACRG